MTTHGCVGETGRVRMRAIESDTFTEARRRIQIADTSRWKDIRPAGCPNARCWFSVTLLRLGSLALVEFAHTPYYLTFEHARRGDTTFSVPGDFSRAAAQKSPQPRRHNIPKPAFYCVSRVDPLGLDREEA